MEVSISEKMFAGHPNNVYIDGKWGYAIVEKDVIWIPAIMTYNLRPLRMKDVLKELHDKTGLNRMIFSAVVNPKVFKQFLRNIVREWDEWFSEAEDWSHCIEIKYECDCYV